jgi:hypothetical protein
MMPSVDVPGWTKTLVSKKWLKLNLPVSKKYNYSVCPKSVQPTILLER